MAQHGWWEQTVQIFYGGSCGGILAMSSLGLVSQRPRQTAFLGKHRVRILAVHQGLLWLLTLPGHLEPQGLHIRASAVPRLCFVPSSTEESSSIYNSTYSMSWGSRLTGELLEARLWHFHAWHVAGIPRTLTKDRVVDTVWAYTPNFLIVCDCSFYPETPLPVVGTLSSQSLFHLHALFPSGSIILLTEFCIAPHLAVDSSNIYQKLRKRTAFLEGDFQ